MSTRPTRSSKIGRLPFALRQQLNLRLAEGESQQQLVAWLNENDLVLEHLDRHFDGRPITEQNLSDWKLGGFLDWQRDQEARSLVCEFLGQTEEVGAELGGEVLLDRVSDLVALVLLRLFREAASAAAGPAQVQTVLEIARELTRIRHADHQRQRVNLLTEQQRRVPLTDFQLQHRMHREEDARIEKELAEFRVRAEGYRAEYLAGREDGTLTPERRQWIEEFFERYPHELDEACVDPLPEDESVEDDGAPAPPEEQEKPTAVPPAARRKKAASSQGKPAASSPEPVAEGTTGRG